MGRFKKLNHTIYECKYHVVWIPKYRFRVMEGEVRLYVRDVLRRMCEWRKVEIIEGNVCADHIHVVLDMPPKLSVAEVLGFLKGKSAVRIFKKFPRLRKKYWGMHYWSPGYCVTTVGLDEEMIRRYVRWQQKQDQENDAAQQQDLFKGGAL